MKLGAYIVVIQYGAGRSHIRWTGDDLLEARRILWSLTDIRPPAKNGKKLGAAPQAYIYDRSHHRTPA